MGRNIKDGDRVYYKIQSGTIRTGKYEEKTKSVKLVGGATAKPPMVALFKQKATAEKNPFVKLTAGKVGYKEPEKVKKGRPAGKKTATEKIKGDKRRKTGKYATEKKETPKPKATKKPRRKTYYAGYDRFGGEEEEQVLSDGWKMDSSYGDFNVYKRSMASLDDDTMEFWDNAPYRSIGKKLVYGNRQDFKSSKK